MHRSSLPIRTGSAPNRRPAALCASLCVARNPIGALAGGDEPRFARPRGRDCKHPQNMRPCSPGSRDSAGSAGPAYRCLGVGTRRRGWPHGRQRGHRYWRNDNRRRNDDALDPRSVMRSATPDAAVKSADRAVSWFSGPNAARSPMGRAARCASRKRKRGTDNKRNPCKALAGWPEMGWLACQTCIVGALLHERRSHFAAEGLVAQQVLANPRARKTRTDRPIDGKLMPGDRGPCAEAGSQPWRYPRHGWHNSVSVVKASRFAMQCHHCSANARHGLGAWDAQNTCRTPKATTDGSAPGAEAAGARLVLDDESPKRPFALLLSRAYEA